MTIILICRPVVLRSLFTPDGQLYKSTNKSVILNEIENLTNLAHDVLFHTSSFLNEQNSVIIFDIRAIVSLISIENSQFIKTCEDFTNVFTNQINPFSANLTKWSKELKQFVSKLPRHCLSVFDHFV